MSREVHRAPVKRAQDPLQLNLSSPEDWAIPKKDDPDYATSTLESLANKVHTEASSCFPSCDFLRSAGVHGTRPLTSHWK